MSWATTTYGLLIGSKKPKQIADAHMSGYVGLYEHMYAKIVKATKGMAQGQQ
jgi:copper oxidase (laccase) domain-containing protein